MPDTLVKKNIEQMPTQEQSEQIPSSEQKTEKAIEKIIHERKSDDLSPASVVIPDDTEAKKVVISQGIKVQDVEVVLAQDMERVFLSMDAATQSKFRVQGEKTATEITNLLKKAKIKVGEIINLIVNWLRVIPGVNKHFIEQEAKIKADLILKMHKNKK